MRVHNNFRLGTAIFAIALHMQSQPAIRDAYEMNDMHWYKIAADERSITMNFPNDNDEFRGLGLFFSKADDEDVIREIDECLADILSGKKLIAKTGIQCEHPIYIYPDRVDVEYFPGFDDGKRYRSILPLEQFVEFYAAWKSALVELKRNRATPVD